MASKTGEHGTFHAPKVAQSQPKPGLEEKMQPPSEATKLEAGGQFIEYVGCGKLKDKKVLITGGDSGIGRSVAILMAREGADVTIVYLPEEQVDAEATKKSVEAEGRVCHLFAGNLMDNETCRKAVESHVQKFGRVNVLVNNASQQFMCKDFEKIDLDKVETLFRTNILQMFAITKFALPHMTKGDSIINNSSVTTFRGSPSMIDYTATKGAIVGFTRSLAANLIPKGIRVNAVAPGAIYTPIQVDTRSPAQMENFHAKSKIGRPGQPSEVAPSFVFLANPESSLYYGQILHCYPLGD